MADDSNPFQAFDNPGDASVADHRELLAQTQPWLMVLGVLSAVVTALMLLFTVVFAGMSVLGVAAGGDDPELAQFGMASGAMGVVISVFYGLFSLLYGGFAWFMIKQALAIGRLKHNGGLDALGDVLRAHRDFWRLAGISTVAFIALYCGGIMVFATMGAMLGSAFEGG